MIVLRNTDQAITEARLAFASRFIMSGDIEALLMVSADNTRAEAELIQFLEVLPFGLHLGLVTDDYHMPRAYLTYLKVFAGSGRTFYPLSLSTDLYGALSPYEAIKIDKYQEKGDIASYEEGLAALCSLKPTAS